MFFFLRFLEKCISVTILERGDLMKTDKVKNSHLYQHKSYKSWFESRKIRIIFTIHLFHFIDNPFHASVLTETLQISIRLNIQNYVLHTFSSSRPQFYIKKNQEGTFNNNLLVTKITKECINIREHN